MGERNTALRCTMLGSSLRSPAATMACQAFRLACTAGGAWCDAAGAAGAAAAGAGLRSMRRASSVPCLMARLASSSAALSAPPIRCTRTPWASSAACSSRLGSWPAQTMTLSTGRVMSLSPTVMCRPASSMRRYCTPGIISTPRFFRPVRWIQPVVLPRPSPTLLVLRCSR